MASLKEVRNRIVSVSSTQQITKAMKMVAAAKLRRAQDSIIRMRPYAQRLSSILTNLSRLAEDSVPNVYSQKRDINRVLIIVVTSDRGLAGAFNANVIKAVHSLVHDKYASQMNAGQVEFLTIGRKGQENLSRRGYKMVDQFTNTFANLCFG